MSDAAIWFASEVNWSNMVPPYEDIRTGARTEEDGALNAADQSTLNCASSASGRLSRVACIRLVGSLASSLMMT